MKKHISKPIILFILGSLLFSGCALEYRDGYRRDRDYRYHDRDAHRYNDRDYHHDDRDYGH